MPTKSNEKPEKTNFTYPVNLRFACNRCGLCCGDTKQKTRHILLIEAEAKRIAAQTACLASDFSVEIKGKLQYVYEMKKTTDGKCVYLRDNQCSIYKLRPLICRFYPFELKFDEEKGLYSFAVTLECPTVNEGEVFDEKDFKKLFRLAQQSLGWGNR